MGKLKKELEEEEKSMIVSVYINRFDIIILNAYVFTKMKMFYVYLLLIHSCFFLLKIIVLIKLKFIFSLVQLFSLFFHSFFTLFIFSFIGSWLILGLWLITLNEDDGVIGRHDFKIKDSGFEDITSKNNKLYKWRNIKSIYQSDLYIYIKINFYMFHIIPKRAFNTTKQLNEFLYELQKNYKKKY